MKGLYSAVWKRLGLISSTVFSVTTDRAWTQRFRSLFTFSFQRPPNSVVPSWSRPAACANSSSPCGVLEGIVTCSLSSSGERERAREAKDNRLRALRASGRFVPWPGACATPSSSCGGELEGLATSCLPSLPPRLTSSSSSCGGPAQLSSSAAWLSTCSEHQINRNYIILV